MKKVDQLEQHLAFGDYQFLQLVTDPSVIGCYLKSVLKYMEEPLCTFEMYPMFKVICEGLPTSTAPHEGILMSLSAMLIQCDSVHRETWRFVLRFLSLIGQSNSKLSIKNISTIFSDIFFKPREYRANDMLTWKLFTELLALMINEHNLIFDEVDKGVHKMQEELL